MDMTRNITSIPMIIAREFNFILKINLGDMIIQVIIEAIKPRTKLLEYEICKVEYQ